MTADRLFRFSNGKEYCALRVSWGGNKRWVAVEIDDEITREMFKFGHNHKVYTNRKAKNSTRGTEQV